MKYFIQKEKHELMLEAVPGAIREI